MIDIYTAFTKLLLADNNLNDVNSLHSLVGGRFLSHTFILQIDPNKVDITKDLPRIVYYGTPLPSYLDKLSMMLVASCYTKSYNDCTALANRITDLIYSPNSRPGINAPTLKPAGSLIGSISMPENATDAYNSTAQVYERTIKFHLNYVKR